MLYLLHYFDVHRRDCWRIIFSLLRNKRSLFMIYVPPRFGETDVKKLKLSNKSLPGNDRAPLTASWLWIEIALFRQKALAGTLLAESRRNFEKQIIFGKRLCQVRSDQICKIARAVLRWALKLWKGKTFYLIQQRLLDEFLRLHKNTTNFPIKCRRNPAKVNRL